MFCERSFKSLILLLTRELRSLDKGVLNLYKTEPTGVEASQGKELSQRERGNNARPLGNAC
jgi:hypothetical protein